MAPDEVVPDTKDWVWVLERRCPECGVDVTGLAGDEISLRLLAALPRWGTALMDPAVRARPSPGTWSPLEYGAHVRDVLTVLISRVELMLSHDSPTFAAWDQDGAAADGRYDALEPVELTADLDAAGRAAAERFESLTAGQLARTGRRSDGREFTVVTLGRYFVHDVEHHLHDVGA